MGTRGWVFACPPGARRSMRHSRKPADATRICRERFGFSVRVAANIGENSRRVSRARHSKLSKLPSTPAVVASGTVTRQPGCAYLDRFATLAITGEGLGHEELECP